jgi:pimeloyl-ACP methyl ester carboxylesterase
VAGDGDRVVVVHVGSPNAGVLYDYWVEDAAGRGLTLVTYDRPGYGGSTRQPGRTVADCAADVRSISEALGFERCAVWGYSGGGPHALACGA